jgi:phosphoribosylamine--glycine ligase
MKFLWISKDADTLSLAMKVYQEGNEVFFYIQNPKKKHCGDGLIEKTDDWRKELSKDAIICFDMVGSGRLATQLKNAGYLVFGGSLLADSLELDRVYGSSVMQTAGIKIPKTVSFTSFKEAIAYVEKTQGKFVFKPSGNMSTALTYVSSNWLDMLQFLKGISKQMHKKIEFELQSYIEGIECSSEGLFNGQDWVDGWANLTLERKRFMNDDYGQNTGCMLDVVKVLPLQRETPIFKKTLEKLTPFLRTSGYMGLLDINCIYFNGTPFGLEYTSRFGIDAIYTMLELVEDDIGKIISDCARGQLKKVRTNTTSFSASVRCLVPENKKIPHRLIQNIKNFNHIHPLDMMIDKEGNLVCADTDYALAIITASGYNILDASERVYYLLNRVEKFGINDLQVRTDCGKKAEKDYQQLLKWRLV